MAVRSFLVLLVGALLGDPGVERLATVRQCLHPSQGSTILATSPDAIDTARSVGQFSYDLVVAMLTVKEHKKEQQAMLTSWANAGTRCSVLFILVLADGERSATRSVWVKPHVLELTVATPELYANLPAKVLGAFGWIGENVDFKYLLKTDDDAFPCVGGLLAALAPLPRTLLYWGKLRRAGQPVEVDGKWQDERFARLLASPAYGVYAFGAGYILSADLVSAVASRMHSIAPACTVEDGLVGAAILGTALPTWARPANSQPMSAPAASGDLDGLPPVRVIAPKLWVPDPDPRWVSFLKQARSPSPETSSARDARGSAGLSQTSSYTLPGRWVEMPHSVYLVNTSRIKDRDPVKAADNKLGPQLRMLATSAPRAAPMLQESGAKIALFDIGANLLDGMFQGMYNGKRAHPPDLSLVLARAAAAGVRDVIVTAGCLADSRRALALVRELRGSSPVRLSCTVGVHPTRCDELEQPTEAGALPTTIAQLLELARDGMADGSVVAIGELGLDFDRLQFCKADVQLRGFEAQLALAEATGLPLFLHNRNTSGAFTRSMEKHRELFARGGGVVHSFDGGREELDELLALGLSIGINGCSLRTADNLRVAASVPLDRLLIETDAPWCQIRPTHAGQSHVRTRFAESKKESWDSAGCVKSRNEPCHVVQVLEVLAAVREQSVAELGAAVFGNAHRLFYRDSGAGPRPAAGAQIV